MLLLYNRFGASSGRSAATYRRCPVSTLIIPRTRGGWCRPDNPKKTVKNFFHERILLYNNFLFRISYIRGHFIMLAWILYLYQILFSEETRDKKVL